MTEDEMYVSLQLLGFEPSSTIARLWLIDPKTNNEVYEDRPNKFNVWSNNSLIIDNGTIDEVWKWVEKEYEQR